MSLTADKGQPSAPSVPAPRFQFTVADLYALSSVGLFTGRRVQLWDGDIIDMTVNPPHAKAVTALQKILTITFADRAIIYSQNPLDLGEPKTLPEPDVMLLKPGEYTDAAGRDRHPVASEVLLLIEVSDTTLLMDQTKKLSTYAAHGVGEYWIADLKSETWYVHHTPFEDGYRTRLSYRFGEAFAPLAFAEQADVWL